MKLFRQGLLDDKQIYFMVGDSPSDADICAGTMIDGTMARIVVQALNEHPVHGTRDAWFTRSTQARDHDNSGN